MIAAEDVLDTESLDSRAGESISLGEVPTVLPTPRRLGHSPVSETASTNEQTPKTSRADRVSLNGFVPRKTTRKSTRRLTALQQWEGLVVRLGEDEFSARLHDLTVINATQEVGTFSIDDVSPSDRGLLEVGAVFYWTIGYELRRSGQLNRVSEIRFRRLPRWSKRQIEDLDKEAEEMLKRMCGDDDAGASEV